MIVKFLSRKHRGLLAIIAVLMLWSAAYALTFFQTFKIDDDNLYFYYTAYAVTHPHQHEVLWGALSEKVQDFGDPAEKVRDTINRNYTGNYRLSSYTWYLAIQAYDALKSRWPTLDESSGPLQWNDVAVPLAAGSFVLGLMGLILAFRVADPGLRSALIFTIILMVVLAYPASTSNPSYLPLGEFHFLQDTFNFIFCVPVHFNMFSFEPRGTAAIWVLPVFILRWRGMLPASYALMLLIVFLHRSNAGLLILTLTVIDVIYQPRALFRPATLAAILATLVIIGVTEPLLDIAGWPVLAKAAVAAGLALSASRLVWMLLIEPLLRPDFFSSSPAHRAALEIAFFWVGWLVSLLIVRYAWEHQLFDWVSGRYSWFQLHTRMGMLLLGPSLLAILYILFRAINHPVLDKIGKFFLVCLLGLVMADIANRESDAGSPMVLTDGINNKSWSTRKTADEYNLTWIAQTAFFWATGKPLSYIEDNETIWYFGMIMAMRDQTGYFPGL